ncbi:MAG: cysteine--tRNA ligase [Bacteroidales bacterium]|jgi:cysteinyl-tRNA synthetase|nr:cysteine--tRNA ligase [Bacteroidales bacterium]
MEEKTIKSHNLKIYNTLFRKKEPFEPLKPPFVGMYVCGPTVYGEPHLGHARPAIVFDLIFRYLKFLGYKVRYVRNITDVGHLENDADEGEDKIAKKALVEQLEPMEIAQLYLDKYHFAMDALNVLRPSIEARASGHIMEQIDIVQKILDAGYAYVSNGSVYFDVVKYDKKYPYGVLSGRKLEELLSNTRALDGQEEKHNQADFALWKKALPSHIMKWKSPWSDGFPGWHLECTAMSTKYLGKQFDIHGGGMDLMFPHHEAEICQNTIANETNTVKYWIHNNMITINGQKMGKSLGNFITLDEFFTGKHDSLQQAYHPMTIRFFILQAHYGSTVDFSNEALVAAEKGLKRLCAACELLCKLKPSDVATEEVGVLYQNCLHAMDDDFNSPVVIANLFEAVRMINQANDGTLALNQENINELKNLFQVFLFDVLGMKPIENETTNGLDNDLMNIIIELRQRAKNNKDYTTADAIRDMLLQTGVTLKDTKNGVEWSINQTK